MFHRGLRVLRRPRDLLQSSLDVLKRRLQLLHRPRELLQRGRRMCLQPPWEASRASRVASRGAVVMQRERRTAVSRPQPLRRPRRVFQRGRRLPVWLRRVLRSGLPVPQRGRRGDRQPSVLRCKRLQHKVVLQRKNASLLRAAPRGATPAQATHFLRLTPSPPRRCPGSRARRSRECIRLCQSTLTRMGNRRKVTNCLESRS